MVDLNHCLGWVPRPEWKEEKRTSEIDDGCQISEGFGIVLLEDGIYPSLYLLCWE